MSCNSTHLNLRGLFLKSCRIQLSVTRWVSLSPHEGLSDAQDVSRQDLRGQATLPAEEFSRSLKVFASIGAGLAQRPAGFEPQYALVPAYCRSRALRCLY